METWRLFVPPFPFSRIQHRRSCVALSRGFKASRLPRGLKGLTSSYVFIHFRFLVFEVVQFLYVSEANN
jgi:hypothetical protein